MEPFGRPKSVWSPCSSEARFPATERAGHASRPMKFQDRMSGIRRLKANYKPCGNRVFSRRVMVSINDSRQPGEVAAMTS